jgi:lysozyme
MRSRLFALVVGFAVGSAACVGDAPPEPTGTVDDGTAGAGLNSTGDTGDVGGEGANMYARVCASGTVTKGIDVSYYQGTINWTSVASSGIKFAFIRVSDGTGFHDPKFTSYWAGAHNAGIIRGAYQFFRPSQSVSGQANLMISALGGHYTPGDLPPVLDVEDAGGESAATVASKIRQWVDQVKQTLGVDPIIYTGKYFWRDEVGGPTSFVTNALWIAQYTSLCPDLPSPWPRWTFWQNTDTGSVSGISGHMDLDQFNGTLVDLQAFANGSGTTPPPPPTTCNSATLDKDVAEGVCVQAASDAKWYECSSGMWVARSSSSGCAQAYAWCASATLGASEPPRTCVQAASDQIWYQCDGSGWATPVADGAGPAGTCSSMHAL